jgi:5-methylcytosine-specific restriction enzyme B
LEAILAPQQAKAAPDNFVLVIDEINRANISKVLGELISLLEVDKRIGAAEELRVRLPYSQKEFGVPKNLYVVGTMNTADRSIALLDTALRRRFEFREIDVDYTVIQGEGNGLIPDGQGGEINLRYLLMAINDRIEFLLGRDQRIGHAYLTRVVSLPELNRRFQQQIIPLLQEYFYEDWAGIAKVLAVPKGVSPFFSKRAAVASEVFGAAVIDDVALADSQDRYSIVAELTGDMYRGLYAARIPQFAAQLISN